MKTFFSRGSLQLQEDLFTFAKAQAKETVLVQRWLLKNKGIAPFRVT